MVIIEITYKKPLNAVEQHLQEHREFLSTYYKKNIFIASGPKIPRDGGIILANATKDEVKAIIKNDPFYIDGVADYRFIQFEPNKYSAEFKAAVSRILPRP